MTTMKNTTKILTETVLHFAPLGHDLAGIRARYTVSGYPTPIEIELDRRGDHPLISVSPGVPREFSSACEDRTHEHWYWRVTAEEAAQ